MADIEFDKFVYLIKVDFFHFAGVPSCPVFIRTSAIKIIWFRWRRWVIVQHFLCVGNRWLERYIQRRPFISDYKRRRREVSDERIRACSDDEKWRSDSNNEDFVIHSASARQSITRPTESHFRIQINIPGRCLSPLINCHPPTGERWSVVHYTNYYVDSRAAAFSPIIWTPGEILFGRRNVTRGWK